MKRKSLLFASLLLCVLAQEDWNNWNPSPPLGPRPLLTLPLNEYQERLQAWCQGCILRCIFWRDKDFPECATSCACPILPKVITQSTFLPPLDSSQTCPLGYAPTPVLTNATDNAAKRTVQKNVDDLDELVTPYFQAMPFAKWLFQDHGVKFNRAYSSTSICCAARCQFLTGLYGHNVGVLANSGEYGGVNAFKAPLDQSGSRLKDVQGRCISNELRSLPLLLQQAGYKTGIWGKFLNGMENDDSWAVNYPVPPGWDEFAIGSTRSFYTGYHYAMTVWDSSRAPTDISYEYRGLSALDYSTDVLNQKTTFWVDKIRLLHGNVPVFMYINPSAPHFPITAAPRHRLYANQWNNLYNSTVPVRPNWNESLTDKPSYLRNTADLRRSLVNSPWYRLEFVKRMGSLMAVDDLIESIYTKFALRGELDNTVFILAADNGYNNGAHLLTHKMAPYEESVRVPLYFSGGGIFQGQSINEPALLIDLAPTILDFANRQAPSYLDGKSWWRNLLINLTSVEAREDVYLQYKKYSPGAPDDTAFSELQPAVLAIAPDSIAIDIPPYRGIRKLNSLFLENLVIFSNGTTGVEYEYYDMQTDPYQLTNIIGQISDETFQTHLDDLNDIAACSGSNCW